MIKQLKMGRELKSHPKSVYTDRIVNKFYISVFPLLYLLYETENKDVTYTQSHSKKIKQ
jgi:hypothetical protein